MSRWRRVRISCASAYPNAGLSLEPHRKRAKPCAGGAEDCVSDCRGDSHDRRFACAGRRDVLPIEKNRLNARRVAETRDTVARKARVQDAAVFELDFFEQCASNAHNGGALHLIFEVLRIDDGSAFKGRDGAFGLYYPLLRNGNFSTAGRVTALFETTRDAESARAAGYRFSPAEAFRRGFENITQPFVFDVLQPKLRAAPCRRNGQARPCTIPGRNGLQWRPIPDRSPDAKVNPHREIA